MDVLVNVFTTLLRAGAVAFFAYKILLLLDCLKRPDTEFPSASPHDKILWAAAVFLLPLGIGAALYDKFTREKPSRWFQLYLPLAGGWAMLFAILYLIQMSRGLPVFDIIALI